MEHDIHLGCLGEDQVPWIDQSLHSPHGKSSIVYSYQMHETKLDVPGMHTYRIGGIINFSLFIS